MANNVYRNSEGYYDQTAGAAIASLDRKQRSDRRKAIRKANARARKQAVLDAAVESAIEAPRKIDDVPEGGGCE